MANKVYPEFILARAKGTSTEDLSSGAVNVKAVLVDTASYTYSDAHAFLSDIAVGARIATSGDLVNKTVVRSGDDVVFDADDFDIVIPAAQPSIEAFVIYIDTGVAGTSRLVRYYDTGTGFPFTPNASGETRQIRIDPTGWMRWNNP
jgi:Neuraminidase (sialidase)